ncbi:hypothetical protein BOTBODRAFT_182519 [Botryobasidium botryosum FD-172 SS1]|uniref:Uncharacterized protein n=1 Tax=Botryobasidium botryosum (strain FD-172 SS1) TaxID=930990 RepID=A0A067M0U0_BOTB1|nr:hypothetical protein BOTBODRAFT_182519 [Botryobasidium botryosum FD-172 SS1]
MAKGFVTFARAIRQFNLDYITINLGILQAAHDRSESLYKSAATKKWDAILLSPEQPKIKGFHMLLNSRAFRKDLRTTCIGEAHLSVQWGADFGPAYDSLGTLHGRMPDHTMLVGLTTICSMGATEIAIRDALGLRKDDPDVYSLRQSNKRLDI